MNTMRAWIYDKRMNEQCAFACHRVRVSDFAIYVFRVEGGYFEFPLSDYTLCGAEPISSGGSNGL